MTTHHGRSTDRAALKEGETLESVVKIDRLVYLSEMAAAAAGIAVFVAVYLIGYFKAGFLLTVLLGWVPAALLGWLTARAVRHAAAAVFHLDPAEGALLPLGERAMLQPIAVRDARRRAMHRVPRERDWR